GADHRQTIHAALTVSVETLAPGVDVAAYHEATLRRLGDAYGTVSRGPWRGGFVDVLQAETPLSILRSKRFFRAAAGRGYQLGFEARADVYPRVSRWCDIIAGTLEIGPEMRRP